MLAKVKLQLEKGALVQLENGHTMVYVSGRKGREIHSGGVYKKLVERGCIASEA